MLKRLQLWFYAYGWAWVLVLTASFFQRRRMSHNNGRVLSGRVRVVSDPAFPPHDFFEPGREFPCRLRHASVSYDDDAIIQVRSASLKLADSCWESPLDIEMNTGRTSLFWTARNFFEFALDGRMTDGLAFRQFYEKHPTGLEAAKDGIRKAPSSFAELHYYSQCAQLFIGKDGVRRYVKFRLIPFDGGPETGIIPEEELKDLWVEVPLPGETRSQNYLKDELVERVSRGPVKYRFQLQLHTPEPGESDEIFNCNVAWDDEKHPYMDVATVELDKMLPFDESNRMRSSLRHRPPSLALLPSASIDDYNSINYIRAHSDWAKQVRVFANKLFGMPKPVPDERPKGA
jgi:hypothetical protein